MDRFSIRLQYNTTMHEVSLQQLLYPDEDSYDEMDSSSDEGDEAMTGGAVILCFWLIVAISNGYLVYLAYKYRGRRRLLRRVQDEEEGNSADPHTIAKKLAGMTTDAKIDYYNTLFDKQGNQRTLTEEHIIMVDIEKDGSNKGLAIEKDIEPCDACGESEMDADENLSLVYLSPSIIPTGEINDEYEKNSSSRLMHTIDGQCAICLETYQPGDIVVYNMHICGTNKDIIEDNDQNAKEDSTGEDSPAETCDRGCYHVYHKTCLVQYLANRKISQKALKDGQADTPSCPTCREPYVQLLPIRNDVTGQSETEFEIEASQVSAIESDDETPVNVVDAAQAGDSNGDRDPESQLQAPG